jgi:hypothetical protein
MPIPFFPPSLFTDGDRKIETQRPARIINRKTFFILFLLQIELVGGGVCAARNGEKRAG